MIIKYKWVQFSTIGIVEKKITENEKDLYLDAEKKGMIRIISIEEECVNE